MRGPTPGTKARGGFGKRREADALNQLRDFFWRSISQFRHSVDHADGEIGSGAHRAPAIGQKRDRLIAGVAPRPAVLAQAGIDTVVGNDTSFLTR